MTREEVQQAWKKIVDTGLSDYKSLSLEQREWFNIEPLTTGGIVDHYVNSSTEHNEDTISDLEYLEFNDIADLLRKFNQLFPAGKPPADINQRNDQMADWDEGSDTFIDEIERQYWKRNDALEDSLLKHINRTGIGKHE